MMRIMISNYNEQNKKKCSTEFVDTLMPAKAKKIKVKRKKLRQINSILSVPFNL